MEQRINRGATAVMGLMTLGLYTIYDELKRPTEIVTCSRCEGSGSVDEYLPLSEQEGACDHDFYVASQGGEDVTVTCRYCGKTKTA